MPRLVLFTACERVIIDVNGPVSLIGIFQRMRYPVQGAPLPDKAVAPNQWAVFSLWETEPHEREKDFKQTIRVYAPDGSLWAEQSGNWRNDSEENQVKIAVNVGGLPIWAEGHMTIKAWLGDAEQEVGFYRFGIQYVPREHPATGTPIITP